MSLNPTPKRVLFLMSDTGGGHRAAAEAIKTAMDAAFPDKYTCDIVDVFRHYTPFPFKFMPQVYPIWVNVARFSWKLGYILINSKLFSSIILYGFYLICRRGLRRLLREHPADVIVCVHSLFNRAGLRAAREFLDKVPPYITVVTDLVSTPVFWYQRDVDLCVVPTPRAHERGVKLGMPPEKLMMTGLPVHPHFVEGVTSREEARANLGWDADHLTVLVVSGGEGMGPIFEITRAIDEKKLDIQLAIITGNNRRLRARLEACRWNQKTHIYPFVSMAQFMSGADILVTKAGPATISEACIAGLPLILSGHIPGQENGNVDYVVDNGAGVYAPGPKRVAQVLETWISQPKEMIKRYAEAALRLGHPDAAQIIAKEIDHIVENAAQGTLPR